MSLADTKGTNVLQISALNLENFYGQYSQMPFSVQAAAPDLSSLEDFLP